MQTGMDTAQALHWPEKFTLKYDISLSQHYSLSTGHAIITCQNELNLGKIP